MSRAELIVRCKLDRACAEGSTGCVIIQLYYTAQDSFCFLARQMVTASKSSTKSRANKRFYVSERVAWPSQEEQWLTEPIIDDNNCNNMYTLIMLHTVTTGVY